MAKVDSVKAPIVISDDKEREKVIEKTLAEMNKQFGAGSISALGNMGNMDVEHVSTGSLAFDYITGGGLARGRIHEFFGPEGSGKTSVALQTIATVQRNGGVAAFIDMEHALDPKQAARLGVNVQKLLVSQPDYAEQALDMMIALISSGAVDIVVLDSVAALVPKAEVEGNMEHIEVGTMARILGKGLRKITGLASQTNTIVVFINQVREAVGVLYGPNEVTPGGKSLKFYSSIRVRVSKGKVLTVKNQPVGQHVFLKCHKNKVGVPFLNSETDFYFRGGMDLGYDIMTYGTQFGVINKAGGNYCKPDGTPIEYNGENVRNKDALAEALHDKSTGLQELFYQPVLDAMDKQIQDAFNDSDNSDTVESNEDLEDDENYDETADMD